MPRHTLAHGCKGVARDLVYEAQHPFAELAEEGLSNSCVTCNCPANHGWRQPQELGVHQCLRRRRHGEAAGEQRYGADERAGPAIAHSHRATVGSGYEPPNDARDHQLKVRSGFTFSMRDRASRNLHPDRARQELFDHVGWQLMQVRLQHRGAYISIHGRTIRRFGRRNRWHNMLRRAQRSPVPARSQSRRPQPSPAEDNLDPRTGPAGAGRPVGTRPRPSDPGVGVPGRWQSWTVGVQRGAMSWSSWSPSLKHPSSAPGNGGRSTVGWPRAS